MADISLSAAVRQSLLSLQTTTSLIESTQGRLSTGLKVSSAIDDPVAYFQSKTLTDRAFDFNEKKDAIDQGISTLTAATDGINAVENLVRQLKGTAQGLKSATGTQFTDLLTQLQDVRDQIDLLTADSSYQGVNLINGVGETLTVEFSPSSGSEVSVSSIDATANGLDVANAVATTGAGTAGLFNYADAEAQTLASGGSLTFTYVGETTTLATVAAGTTFTISYGDATLTLNMSGGAVSLTQGQTYTINIASVGAGTAQSGTAITASLSGSGTVAVAATDGAAYVAEGNATSIDEIIDSLSDALSTLRSEAGNLGSNVSLLQTRFDFTENYVNTLEVGSSKLTLADINQEGANLLALQTRQQLGIQSLAFAGQNEQGILSLFR